MGKLFFYRLRVRIALRLRKIISASPGHEQAVVDAYDALVAAEPRIYDWETDDA